MASTATSATAGATEEAKAVRWLRVNNGVPIDDGDNTEEEEEGVERGGAGRSATYAAAGYGEAEAEEMQVGPGDGRAETVSRGAKAEMVARVGGNAEKEAAGAGGKRRSSTRFADPAALDEDISGGNYLQPAELPRGKREAVAKRSKLKFGGTEVQNNISQAQSLPPVVKGPERVHKDIENLKLQLALKTTELKQEENRRLQLELNLKSKETESLQKQIKDLKAENEQLRKNAKPQKLARLCRFCNELAMHDYRNCPKRREAASSPEEEDG